MWKERTHQTLGLLVGVVSVDVEQTRAERRFQFQLVSLHHLRTTHHHVTTYTYHRVSHTHTHSPHYRLLSPHRHTVTLPLWMNDWLAAERWRTVLLLVVGAPPRHMWPVQSLPTLVSSLVFTLLISAPLCATGHSSHPRPILSLYTIPPSLPALVN